jgi:hypothetical protein
MLAGVPTSGERGTDQRCGDDEQTKTGLVYDAPRVVPTSLHSLDAPETSSPTVRNEHAQLAKGSNLHGRGNINKS